VKKRAIFVAVLTFLLTLSFVIAAQAFDSTTFIFATNEEIDTLDPAVTYANTSFREIYVLYDRLVTYEGASIEPKPMLATHWDISEDGLTYTFYLRKDVKFHDETPVTAEAVQYSFVRAIEIGKGPTGLYTGIIDTDSCEVVDDYTFRLHLLQKFPPLIPLLGMTMGAVVNPSVADHAVDGDHGEAWLTENDAGSGPFILESWERGQEMVLAANKDYWGGAPILDKVVIRIVPEPSTLRMLMETGEIDMAEGISIDAVAGLQVTAGVTVDIVDGMFIHYLNLNTKKGPFQDRKLRQAVAYAVDYDAIIEGVSLGLAIQLRSPIPKPMLGFDENLPEYRHDPVEAKRLLAEAGKAGGFEVDFLIAPFDTYQRISTSVQNDLRKIGITANIQQFAWPTYMQKLFDGEFDISVMGWSPDYADPDQNMWTHLHSTNAGPGWNLAHYQNPEVDYWMFQTRQTTDPQKRAQYFVMAQALAISDSPYIWLQQRNFLPIYRSWVKGYEPNPMMNFYVAFDKIYKEQ